jgi:hypothetical protein
MSVSADRPADNRPGAGASDRVEVRIGAIAGDGDGLASFGGAVVAEDEDGERSGGVEKGRHAAVMLRNDDSVSRKRHGAVVDCNSRAKGWG